MLITTPLRDCIASSRPVEICDSICPKVQSKYLQLAGLDVLAHAGWEIEIQEDNCVYRADAVRGQTCLMEFSTCLGTLVHRLIERCEVAP